MRTHRADRVLGAALLLAALFLGSSGAAVMAADGPTLTGHDGSFDRVKKSGVLRFGTSNDEPYTFLDPKTKKVEGIDADMTAYVMEKLGIPKREMVQDKFAGLIPGLLSKRFDIISDAMYITPKRQQQIAFSDGWYQYGETIVVPKGNPKNIHTLDDLKKGVTSASYTGTVYQDWLNDLAKQGAKVSSYPTVPELLQDVKIGRVDAALIDAPVAAYVLGQHPELAAAMEPVKGYKPKEIGVIGAGFRKADVDLREAVNWALAEMKKDGTDLKILQKWGLGEENRAPAGR
jgi:polar amino acid transport system substrate-binding protein